MRKYIINSLTALAISASLASCGDNFLETKYYKGIDVETALTSEANIQTALTGVYNQLYDYRFAGNYAVNIGDIPTDLSYWNTKTGHFDGIYQYSFDDKDTYLYYIWDYGFKVVNNSARIIKAGNGMLGSSSDATTLNKELAEAYALRAYSNLIMANVFCHQVKVNGTDFSSKPGLPISDEPIVAFQKISRSTVGETYDKIVADLKVSIDKFTAAGGDRGDKCYFTKASVEGLLARTYLYLEKWDEAKTYAQAALKDGNITVLNYKTTDYKALYNGGSSNTESLFYLDINATQNWSANSNGTLWSTYNFSPSPKLLAMYGANDVRKSIQTWDKTSVDATPVYGGGKYAAFASANPAFATNYLINAPEMFLIIAEANIKLGTEHLTDAQNALLVVAKRNTSITSVADLPQDITSLYAFLKDERARELFQEGFRLWDLRRWDTKASIEAYAAPAVKFRVDNYTISNLIYPIPADEINAGFGIEQNDWSTTIPAIE